MREGLSSDCKLDPLIIIAIMMGGKEHPCDRCNMIAMNAVDIQG